MFDSPLAPTPLALTVIVVSADSGPSLRQCVRSVLACCSTPLELYLVDNASSDGLPQAIARAHESDPRLKMIYNRKNLGFGAAVNRAAEVARGQTLLILNPDCVIDEPTLQRLLGIVESESKVGLLGAV